MRTATYVSNHNDTGNEFFIIYSIDYLLLLFYILHYKHIIFHHISINIILIDKIYIIELPSSNSFPNLFPGEMIVAYADMDIFSHLTPSLLLSPPLPPFLSSARVVVLDSNLPKETIFSLVKYCGERKREETGEKEGERGVDVWVESVSISKCVRVVEGGGLGWVTFVSGNEEEVKEMGGKLGEKGRGEGREEVLVGLMEQLRGEVEEGWKGGRGEWERRVGVLKKIYGEGVVGELVQQQQKQKQKQYREALRKMEEILPFALKVLENGGKNRQTTTTQTLKAIFITLGKSGAFVLTNPSSSSYLLPSSSSSSPLQAFYHPSLPVSHIVNVSGAGDSFISGVISSLSIGSSLSSSLFHGALSASLSLQCDTPISPSLCNISFHE